MFLVVLWAKMFIQRIYFNLRLCLVYFLLFCLSLNESIFETRENVFHFPFKFSFCSGDFSEVLCKLQSIFPIEIYLFKVSLEKLHRTSVLILQVTCQKLWVSNSRSFEMFHKELFVAENWLPPSPPNVINFECNN